MKIRQQAVNRFDLSGRPDKNVRLAFPGMVYPVLKSALQDPERRGPHGENPAVAVTGLINKTGNRFREMIPLAVHPVVGDLLDLNRPEGAKAQALRIMLQVHGSCRADRPKPAVKPAVQAPARGRPAASHGLQRMSG